MKLEEMGPYDIPEVAVMYNELLKVAYPNRRIKPIPTLERLVREWFFNDEKRVRVLRKEDEIIGFSLCSFSDGMGATEIVIDGDISFIKPEHRKTKAAYIMYMDVFNFAVDMGFALNTTATPEASKIIEKRFGAINTFLYWETPSDYINKIKYSNE